MLVDLVLETGKQRIVVNFHFFVKAHSDLLPTLCQRWHGC